ncbi:MAG: hypothetical protein GFH27_549307n191 [Chloroflexi bacterium AL-W]|nr:hypothetical protein [Chloroflexi bacterium AL-N1]NOK69223.1 hypothetical protein [Chloroflexi bacterium AL-N10]NOK77206.1 hypothetical protein [Chloroflexi bacterium AL-N5]NOK83851.1 hypothetical protein [Chloroflexi bacterium AL-W]NOK91061.1 hypothetical protein [Chloroflexi bacterium AL-N15]
MLKHLARLIIVVVGVIMLGFAVAPAAHAGSYCVPFTQICISGYIENNSSYQIGVVGDGQNGPSTYAVLTQGQTTVDLKNQGILYDADFVYSTYYVIYDLRANPTCPSRVCNPLTFIKVGGGEAAEIVNSAGDYGYLEIRDR